MKNYFVLITLSKIIWKISSFNLLISAIKMTASAKILLLARGKLQPSHHDYGKFQCLPDTSKGFPETEKKPQQLRFSLVSHTLPILISFCPVILWKMPYIFIYQPSSIKGFLRNQYLHQTWYKKATCDIKGKIPFLYCYHPMWTMKIIQDIWH